MEVTGQLHVQAALPPGKEPPVPIVYRCKLELLTEEFMDTFIMTESVDSKA
jgi:hypothetical protein